MDYICLFPPTGIAVWANVAKSTPFLGQPTRANFCSNVFSAAPIYMKLGIGALYDIIYNNHGLEFFVMPSGDPLWANVAK
jgi:hypothetical protein